MTEYSGVTVGGMRDLVASLTSAHERLTAGVDALRSGMRSAGLSTARFADVDRMADWIDSRLPELRRRLSLAVGLSGGSPASTRIMLDEESPFATPHEAEGHGRELAGHLLGTSEIGPDLLDDLQAEIEPHVDDPDVMAGFYAELGPDVVERLPNLIHATGSPDGRAHLALLSRGFGAAMSAPYHQAELTPIRRAFTRRPGHPGQAWDRLALLQDGRFPPRWLADAAIANALDDLEGDDWATVSYHRTGIQQLGLTNDVLALAFTVLGDNPAASRLAMAGRNVADHVDRLYELCGRPIEHPELPAAFGRMIEAGSGSKDIRHHRDPGAERLTFEFINASAAHDDVPPAIRGSLERLAASYVHEMVAGAFADAGATAAGVPSSMTDQPNDFPANTGLDPAFFLARDVTGRFIRSFRHSLDPSGPFNDAAGRLFERLLDDAIVADRDHGGHRTPDVMELFGGLAHLEHQARKEYASEFDEQRQGDRSALWQAVGLLLGLAPVKLAWHFIWWPIQGGINGALGRWAEATPSARSQVDAEFEIADSLGWYRVVEVLIDNGVGTELLATAPPGLLGTNGKLRPIGEIYADDELRGALYEWVNDHPELNEPADDAQAGWDAGLSVARTRTVITPSEGES